MERKHFKIFFENKATGSERTVLDRWYDSFEDQEGVVEQIAFKGTAKRNQNGHSPYGG